MPALRRDHPKADSPQPAPKLSIGFERYRTVCLSELGVASARINVPNRREGAIMGEEIWTTIAREFSDVPDVSTITLIIVRLVLAAVLGGILGFERELKRRSAGVRTHMLVAVGAALFVIGPLQRGMPMEDMSRVLQGIVQGIGFLGAGAIIVRAKQHLVEGLTTAANIWATAGIGVIVGLGLEATAVLSTAIVFVILAVIPLILPKPSPSDPVDDGS
jgi:putative Mg2+ transporter-C (MgtC) family protein